MTEKTIVTDFSRTEASIEEFDYRDRYVVKIDELKVFDVSDGEPEDSCLSRDFSSCYSVLELMETAYKAGKEGQEWEFKSADLPKDD